MKTKSSQYLIYNGKIHSPDELLISANNRSFRYGDGFFETMNMIDGNIVLQDFHFERLFSSLQKMQFDKPDFFTENYVLQQIQKLVQINNHQNLSRIRLMIFRSDGNLYDVENNQPNFLIQTWNIESFPSYNTQGFIVDIYKEARKTADAFSGIKSNNYLPYAMAALWSRKNHLDDALIINCNNRVAEATTSNLFLVKDNIVRTPALTEGCIAGVTRRYLLTCMQANEIQCEETELTIEDIAEADEMFFTNAGFYIQYAKQCGDKTYTNTTSKSLYEQFITPLLKRSK